MVDWQCRSSDSIIDDDMGIKDVLRGGPDEGSLAKKSRNPHTVTHRTSATETPLVAYGAGGVRNSKFLRIEIQILEKYLRTPDLSVPFII